jgi:hypothetical protein
MSKGGTGAFGEDYQVIDLTMPLVKPVIMAAFIRRTLANFGRSAESGPDLASSR